MSAEGQTIREALNQIGPGWDMDTKYQAAMAALASLEARLAELEANEKDWSDQARRYCERIVEADAKIARLTARGIEDMQHSLAEAERALREINTFAHDCLRNDGKPGPAAMFHVERNSRAALPSESGTPTTKGTQ